MRRLFLITCMFVAIAATIWALVLSLPEIDNLQGPEEPPSSTAPVLRTLPHSAPLSPAATPVPSRVPTRLRVWHYDATVTPISPIGGTLTPPSDPQTLGWWGRRAGARSGATLLTGHTVHTGGGEFDDLEEIPLGVTANLDGVRYKVVRVEVISKEAFEDRAAALLDQAGEPRLLLVTCEGYDPATGHYDDNVVVTAVPSP